MLPVGLGRAAPFAAGALEATLALTGVTEGPAARTAAAAAHRSAAFDGAVMSVVARSSEHEMQRPTARMTAARPSVPLAAFRPVGRLMLEGVGATSEAAATVASTNAAGRQLVTKAPCPVPMATTPGWTTSAAPKE